MLSQRSPQWIHGNRISSRQASLLWMLAMAAERDMPLIDEIDAIAEDARGRYRRRLHDLTDMLRTGIPLPEALENLPGLLSPQATFAVRIGCETGTLAKALRSAAVNLSANRQDGFFLGNWWFVQYAVSLLVVFSFVVSFQMYFIIPKFKKIFEDFGMELPKSTVMLIDAADFAVTFGLLFVPLILLMLALVLLMSFFARKSRLPGRGRFREILLFPLRMFPRTGTATILRNLALVVDAGKPLVDAISLITYWIPQPSLRTKLAVIEVAVRHSEDCFFLMNKYRFITKPEENLLRAAERSGNLSWAMRHIADNLDRRFWYRFRLLGEFLQPVFFLFFGGIVLAISVGFFMPIVKLLNALS